ncbi:hypothetical protein ATCVOR07043_546L [Acanthocystis turfacea Chlorella virus OR0704.3]|jgi:hypothetical protein|nr:hypothetical protein ATCVOR07043_546L [Acanthocystis turfacea Chlorella virus OR0704.3]
MSEDAMMNATMISDLPSPPSFTQPMDSGPASQGSGQAGSYADILKELQSSQKINQNSAGQQNQMQMSPTPQMQMQMSPPQQNQAPAVAPTPQMMLQTPVNPAPNQNVMQQMQAQASMYSGGMPQSSPIGQYVPQDSTMVHSGPLKSELLPDPMFFQPPPPPRKIKKVYIEKEPEKPKTFLGFSYTKIKSAILVAAIVFALISYVAPLLAKNIPWSVNIETGKFTAAGLLVISITTGLLHLGTVGLIERFGNGVN